MVKVIGYRISVNKQEYANLFIDLQFSKYSVNITGKWQLKQNYSGDFDDVWKITIALISFFWYTKKLTNPGNREISNICNAITQYWDRLNKYSSHTKQKFIFYLREG